MTENIIFEGVDMISDDDVSHDLKPIFLVNRSDSLAAEVARVDEVVTERLWRLHRRR